MKKLITTGKYIAHVSTMAALAVIINFLVEDFIKEVKTYEEPNYADVKGCTAEDFDFSNCT